MGGEVCSPHGGSSIWFPAFLPSPVASTPPWSAGRTSWPACAAAFEQAVRYGTAYRLIVLGDAGIGKSRLAKEFAEALGPDALVVTGHCPAYGDGITFWPLREVALQAAGPRGFDGLAELLIGEEDGGWIADRVAVAIGPTEGPGRANELFPAVRRLFEALASPRPLVLTLEDVHWAEPTFLDLIEYIADWGRAPVFLLCLARPELIEERPTWGAGGPTADTLFLEPLASTDTEKLIADRLAGGMLPPETLTRIVEIGQGNPLFVEQMVAAFEDEGTISLPASVHALLAARLDRLGPAERDLLRCAAVVGTDFSVDALLSLVPEQARPFVAKHLQALAGKQLIRPARPAGEGFSFQHALIQLAAYRSMTREDRARLHQRFAEWLETEAPDSTPELDELLGYHLGEAVAQRRAAGVPDEDELGLAVRAGEHLATAGLRAYGRFDIAAAENLSSRAKSLLPAFHQQRREVMRVLAEAYPMLGRHDEADATVGEMLEQARLEGNRPLEQAMHLERARIRVITGPDPTSLREIREEAERALDVFSTTGDDARAAQACYVLAIVHEREGAIRDMEEVSRLGLVHADRSGRLREEVGPRWNLALAVRTGETPVREAVRTCEELVDRRGVFHPGGPLRAGDPARDGGRVRRGARHDRSRPAGHGGAVALAPAPDVGGAVERRGGDAVTGPLHARPIERGGWVRDDECGLLACGGGCGPTAVARGEGPGDGEPRPPLGGGAARKGGGRSRPGRDAQPAGRPADGSGRGPPLGRAAGQGPTRDRRGGGALRPQGEPRLRRSSPLVRRLSGHRPCRGREATVPGCATAQPRQGRPAGGRLRRTSPAGNGTAGRVGATCAGRSAPT